MKLYRYEYNHYSSATVDGEYYGNGITRAIVHVKLVCDEYQVAKETPKGYWINGNMLYGTLSKPRKWISKTSRKRFAYPTKAQALDNFTRRMKIHQRHILHKLYTLNSVIKLAENEINNIELVKIGENISYESSLMMKFSKNH